MQSSDKPLAVLRSPEIINCFEDTTEGNNTIVEDRALQKKKQKKTWKFLENRVILLWVTLNF